MKKETDKRLIIPKDAFEEEASEGLGRLNREDAAEDMRALEGRLEKLLHEAERRPGKRLRRPLRIWIPAAAAVIIILIASTIYIGLFRDRKPAPEMAIVEESKKDTVLIAMAAPITKAEVEPAVEDKAEDKVKFGNEGGRYVTAVVAEEDAVSEVAVMVEEAMAENEFKAEARVEKVIEIIEMKTVAEEVIVQAVPEMQKAAQGIPARAEAKTEVEAKARTETRAAKDVAVADRQAEYKFAGPDHAPRPTVGIEALNTWISSNINYPAVALSQTVQQVIVSFMVSADSTVYNLKAEQTPGERYTEEAFRLLREGPKWAPAVRNGTFSAETVRVRISFREQ